ncbi:MAG: S1-like domain-containing RNA-binding protein [Bacteroidota bacterium]
MIQLGSYNTLRILRSTSVGLFLGDEEGTEILLPNKYVPHDFEIDDSLEVFCYLDHSERPVATTLTPHVVRNSVAALEVVDLGPYGAFMDWGLEKNLLVPFREQRQPMEVGKKYLVLCYLDETTFRLVGTRRLERHANKEPLETPLNEPLEAWVYRKTPLGWELFLDSGHIGLVFHNDVFQSLEEGQRATCYVKQIRPDGKIDLTLVPIGSKMLEPMAELVLQKLHDNNGILSLHDKSDPEDIKQQLQMSKKAFKKAIGTLYKAGKISLETDHIKLV